MRTGGGCGSRRLGRLPSLRMARVGRGAVDSRLGGLNGGSSGRADRCLRLAASRKLPTGGGSATGAAAGASAVSTSAIGAPIGTVSPSSARTRSNDPCYRRRDFHGHLIGDHLHQWFVPFDLFAGLFQPSADGPFDYRFTDMGKFDGYRQFLTILSRARLLNGPPTLSRAVRDTLGAWHVGVLQCLGERHCGDVGPADPGNGTVQIVERLAGDDGGDFGPDASGDVVLVNDQEACRSFSPS